jgi:hypothetical protein
MLVNLMRFYEAYKEQDRMLRGAGRGNRKARSPCSLSSAEIMTVFQGQFFLRNVTALAWHILI